MRQFLFYLLCTLCTADLIAASAAAQKPIEAAKLEAASLAHAPVILWEPVVTKQWPQTLAAVNAPGELVELSPGQCFRVGVVASGEGHAQFLQGALIGFTVRSGKESKVEAPAPAAAMKDIKPEGSDFVRDVLKAGGKEYEPATMASVAASRAGWCVPADAGAGSVEIDAVASAHGQQYKLRPVTLQVVAPENPPAANFKEQKALGEWIQTYHLHPQPALLGPVLEFAAVNNALSDAVAIFFISAFKQDPASTARMGPWLAKTDPKTRIIALGFLSQTGVTLAQPPELDAEAKALLARLPAFADPYKLEYDQTLFAKLDMLWSIFIATGEKRPVEALAQMLAWTADYDAFKAMQQAGKKPETLTPGITRAIAYSAAGWSLASFDHSDGLAADYLAAMATDPATPAQVKKELKMLHTDPAFDRAGAQPDGKK